MEFLFDRTLQPVWALILALALFLPVRRLIFVLYMRRAQQRQEEDLEALSARLKRRSTVTAALLSLVFSFMYTAYLFRS